MPKRRRRSFTPQFKAQVVLEVLAGLKSPSEIARQHKLKPDLIARWKDTKAQSEVVTSAATRRPTEPPLLFACRPPESRKLIGSRD